MVREVGQALGDDVDDDALALEPARRRHQAGGEYRAVEALEDAGPDDDVGGTGLVLEGGEDDPARAARPLAHEDQARDRDPRAVGRGRERCVGADTVRGEAVAQKCQGMGLEREPEARVIRRHLLAEGSLRECHLGLGGERALPGCGEEGERGLVERLHGPKGRTPVEPERAEGIRLGEALEGGRAQAPAPGQGRGVVIPTLAPGDKARDIGLSQPLHLAEAEAEGRFPRVSPSPSFG